MALSVLLVLVVECRCDYAFILFQMREMPLLSIPAV